MNYERLYLYLLGLCFDPDDTIKHVQNWAPKISDMTPEQQGLLKKYKIIGENFSELSITKLLQKGTSKSKIRDFIKHNRENLINKINVSDDESVSSKSSQFSQPPSSSKKSGGATAAMGALICQGIYIPWYIYKGVKYMGPVLCNIVFFHLAGALLPYVFKGDYLSALVSPTFYLLNFLYRNIPPRQVL